MNIGFDVDGVIVNTEEMFRAYAEIYECFDHVSRMIFPVRKAPSILPMAQ